MTCRLIRAATGARMWLDSEREIRCPVPHHCHLCGRHTPHNVCVRHLAEIVGEVGMLNDILARWVDPPAALAHQRFICWVERFGNNVGDESGEIKPKPVPTPAQVVGWWAEIWHDFDGDAQPVERTTSLVAPYKYLADNVERVGSRHPAFGLFAHDLRYAIEWLDADYEVLPSCPLFEATKDQRWFYLWPRRYLDTLPYLTGRALRCHGAIVAEAALTHQDVHHARDHRASAS